ncbi:hypothetical protein [Microbulbifer agarilyticus]|uniref:hypothetical protein n=1 Tax=Microbulbifer agarilyticus TaxID=260552 RepID=UPI001CD62863|nr:hypothetical protein [Microbulbifer agarilyticus]MCA0894601.1 hypothetical protein [Microbulbifer agarilyticus]
MSRDKASKIRTLWEKNGTKQLKVSRRPAVDSSKSNLISDIEITKNIRKRMSHLAEVLELLHKIYFENTDLYGDRFLAFVGNEVVREWPWKDFPFISEAALELLEECDSYSDITGKLPFEVKDKATREVFKNLRYEHWTPISFFRDVFHSHEPLDKSTYYHLLVNFYRVVWITREEDDLLNKKHRSWRPSDTYAELGIDIVPHEAWSAIAEDSLK